MTEATKNTSVQLGCGTLIVIAIIVALFSGGRDSREVRRELEQINQRLERLEQKIDALTREAAPAERR